MNQLPTLTSPPPSPDKQDARDRPGCSCAVTRDVAAMPASTGAGRVFVVAGLDCSEEVEALRREVGPVAGGADRLEFDLVAGQMVVNAPADEAGSSARLERSPAPRRA